LGRNETYITVGKLGKARGVRGEIYVTPLTDFPERFIGLTEIYLWNDGMWQRTRLESARLISGRPVLKFENVDSPEEASRLTNQELAVPRDQIVPLPANSYYVFDLVGCRIYTGIDGKSVGEVIDVKRYPANDTYVIKMNDGRMMQLPAVRKFVRRVDILKKMILIEESGLIEDA
jgi:16S rRNA processing protein RimM